MGRTLPLKAGDRDDCASKPAGARPMAATRAGAPACRSVALVRAPGNATAATAAMLATPARAPETGEGSACSNSAREASATSCDANERAAPCDGTACSRSEEDEWSSEPGTEPRSGRDDSAMANGVGITLGERGREDMMHT